MAQMHNGYKNGTRNFENPLTDIPYAIRYR